MSGKVGPPRILGPVFAYEWLTSSRRWQGYALRSLFVLLLLAALVVIWVGRSEVPDASTIRALAHLGELFYVAVIGTQLTLVLLAAPAATAGAICLDRSRGTLAHLLVTDLSDVEIVLGKLAARLVPVLGLVGCTLPVMAILILLGGVDPGALVAAFVVALGVAVLGCCLALAFSLWAGKTHEALLGTYAVWGLWLLGAPLIKQLNRAWGWSLWVPIETAGPFVLAFAPYWRPNRVGWGDYLGFLGVTWALSALLVALAVLRLRSVCTREVTRKTWLRAPRTGKHEAASSMRLPRLPGPSLDFNPVLWREWHRNRPSRWARIVATLFVALATLSSAAAIFAGGWPGTSAWVNGLQVSVGLLLLSVSAATALAEERARGSLDVLLATPMSTRQIVLGKWLGTFRLVPLLTILPGLVILSGPGSVIERGAVFVLSTAFVLYSGAAITSLGLALATWSSRLGRAVGLTVVLYVLVAVGWLFLVMMLDSPRDGEGPMMGSPFFFVGELTFELSAPGYPNRLEHYGWAVFWILAYAAVAVALLAATLATFNRCLGRIEAGLPLLAPHELKAVKPVELEEIASESIEVA